MNDYRNKEREAKDKAGEIAFRDVISQVKKGGNGNEGAHNATVASSGLLKHAPILASKSIKLPGLELLDSSSIYDPQFKVKPMTSALSKNQARKLNDAAERQEARQAEELNKQTEQTEQADQKESKEEEAAAESEIDSGNKPISLSQWMAKPLQDQKSAKMLGEQKQEEADNHKALTPTMR